MNLVPKSTHKYEILGGFKLSKSGPYPLGTECRKAVAMPSKTLFDNGQISIETETDSLSCILITFEYQSRVCLSLIPSYSAIYQFRGRNCIYIRSYNVKSD